MVAKPSCDPGNIPVPSHGTDEADLHEGRNSAGATSTQTIQTFAEMMNPPGKRADPCARGKAAKDAAASDYFFYPQNKEEEDTKHVAGKDVAGEE